MKNASGWKREQMGMKYWSGFLFLIMLLPVPLTGTAQAMPADSMPFLLSAPWHGSYMCNQGLTRLRLTLRPLPGSGGNRVEAEFAFSADPDNPQVPTGSFHMTGTLEPSSRLLVLKQDRWIDQPVDPSYRMVDLEGSISIGSDQAMIRGRVTTYGCQDFAVWQFFAETSTDR